MPIQAESAVQATPTYLDTVDYKITNTPPATDDPPAMGTVTARVLDQNAKEYERPSGNLADNFGSITQQELEVFAATQVGETDEARAINTVLWLLGNNRDNFIAELSEAYGAPIMNYEPPAE